MMIAALSIFSSFSQTSVIKSKVLQIEIICYVILAVICLSCIRISSPQLYNFNIGEIFLHDMQKDYIIVEHYITHALISRSSLHLRL